MDERNFDHGIVIALAPLPQIIIGRLCANECPLQFMPHLAYSTTWNLAQSKRLHGLDHHKTTFANSRKRSRIWWATPSTLPRTAASTLRQNLSKVLPVQEFWRLSKTTTVTPTGRFTPSDSGMRSTYCMFSRKSRSMASPRRKRILTL